MLLELSLPAVRWPAWGLRDGETGQPIWPGPAKFFPLAVCLFSISFLWVLGACVIGFKAKAKLSFPQMFPRLPLGSSSLGRPESCPGGMGAAHTHAGLGKGGRSPHAFSLAQFTSRVTFCLRWDLYMIPGVLGIEQGRKGHPPSPPLAPLPPPPPVETTPLPWKPPRSKRYEEMAQSK